jgi:hypothetical protein
MTTTTSPVLLVGLCRPTWPARWQPVDGCALVHAVEVHRSGEELDGEPELACCGAVVSVSTAAWDPAAPDACPACVG